jgi:uncharacterized membrane protein YdjX (TVP38/TMEM64 family)
VKDLKKHLIFVTFLLILFALSKLLTQLGPQNNEVNNLVLQQIQNLSLDLKNFYNLNPVLVTSIFCISFFVATLLYIPFTGSTYVLFAGALFGFYKGAILFSFLVSISYTVSFLISRHFLHDFIRKRMGKRGQAVIHGFEQDGATYLLSLRFAGIIPAVLINAVMGITEVSLRKFYITTQIGTLPHVIVMTYTGSQIVHLTDINGLVPNKFFLLILILSMLPILFKIILPKRFHL